ncbi:YdcF family protein [Clostridium ihumii]|uniref:YdcF family protein n=1 Tax=Clostridium ihumii TaxID=1470356 RepID=UPI003D340F6D
MIIIKHNFDLILGVLFVIYFLTLTIFLGKIAFSSFFLITGIFLIVFHYSKPYFYSINTISSLIKFAKPFLIIFLIVFIVLEGFIIYFSTLKDTTTSDYIVILGAGLKNDKPSLTLKRRLDAVIQLTKTSNESSKIILSGGQGPDEDISEAEAMKIYLLNNGISSNKIILENKSTNTFENFKFSRNMIQKDSNMNFSDIKIKIITSNFHAFRSSILANRNGYNNVTFYNSPTPLILEPNFFTREFFATFKSIIFDK